MIGFIGTSIIITTNHNSSQWLLTTRSIPYRTTNVFSSTVTNDERRITAHTLNSFWIFLRMNYDSFITSRRPEYRSPPRTVIILLLLREYVFVNIRCSGNVCQSVATLWPSAAYPLQRKRVLPSRCLAMDYSGFQASCHNIPSNPLNLGVARLLTCMHYS
jgi:hypothetical protein